MRYSRGMGLSLSHDELVDGRYKLSMPLGDGTFGEVWRADDTRLRGRAVAVKFLKAEFLEHREVVLRFEAEADALAQVQHPNVVAILDRGRWEERLFLVTEFVEGRALSAWINDHRQRAAPPPINAALQLFDQICAGVEAAHAVRAPGPIVHRDLKPDNILVRVTASGDVTVKIVDFGIAQLGGRTGTRTGALMGTPLYMAPEQALGNTAGVGPWTDVFALGVILVEMLSLRAQVDDSAPWWGTALQGGAMTRELLVGMRPDVPSWLWDAADRALRPRSEERYLARRPRRVVRSAGLRRVPRLRLQNHRCRDAQERPLGRTRNARPQHPRRGPRVGQRPVRRLGLQREVLRQRREPMVRRLGEHPSRELHGAIHRTLTPG